MYGKLGKRLQFVPEHYNISCWYESSLDTLMIFQMLIYIVNGLMTSTLSNHHIT